MAGPAANIKDYIIKSRKQGFPDSLIIQNLQSSNWPQDVIEKALQEATAVVAPNPEVPANEQPDNVQNSVQSQTPQQTPAQGDQGMPPSDTISQSGLFTQPPSEITGAKPKAPIEEKKGGFSMWALVALILSPLPFIGLGVSMHALETIRANKKGGMWLAVIALLISLGVILFILYLVYRAFTLDTDQVFALSEVFNKWFDLI